MSDILNNPRQVLQSAIDCKEFSHNHNCGGCPHMIGDYYQGETDDYCFDDMMDNSTNDKAEMMVQIYLLGALDGIKNPMKEHGCSVDIHPPSVD